jgi:hypothetical protein
MGAVSQPGRDGALAATPEVDRYGHTALYPDKPDTGITLELAARPLNSGR